MSKEAVERVISMATMDVGFRRMLLVNPVQALEGFDLSKEEAASLKSVFVKNLPPYSIEKQQKNNELDRRAWRRGTERAAKQAQIRAITGAETGGNNEVREQGSFDKLRGRRGEGGKNSR